ncbi:hypothetical protein [Thermus brockianus]|uniref:Minor tail protein n=1 Tax=Thermus brockianus TaxID=56956 RepID=A0ABM7XHM7_THEBO|nr:hypothetical protein [Thermus brockianus]BDG15798.1 hypothetical protein TbrSNM41_05320 [Thermus brockianus]
MSPIPTRTYKRGSTYGVELRLAPGPRSMGDTGDGSYLTLYGYAWAGLLDRVERRFRLFQAQVPGEGPWPLHDPRGLEVAVWVEVEVPPLPHPVEEIRHLALAFDQAARHVVAYEREGEVWVRQWDPVGHVFVQRGPIPGVDPVLIQDATVGYYPPDSDVLLFHLSPDRTSLVMRVQRELYATAHTIQTFDQPVVLDQAVALPYQVELLGSFLDNLEATGYVIQSELYPVYLAEVAASNTLAPPTSWDYIPIVIVQDTGTEGAGTGQFTAPTDWNYIPIVIVHNVSETASTGDFGAPVAWDYIPAVIVKDLGVEPASACQFAAPTSWNYQLAVIVYNGGTDTAGQAAFAAPVSWSYDPV